MAKVTDLITIPDIADNDVMHIVDTSDTTDDPAGSSFKTSPGALNIFIAGANTKILNSSADLPAPSGGEIAVPGNTNYKVGQDFSVGANTLNFDAGNISWTSGTIFGPKVTYTGSGSMFKGTDMGTVNIFNAHIDCPNGKAFDFNDTTPGTTAALIIFIQIDNCAKEATFDSLFSLTYNGIVVPNSGDGISFLGTGWAAIILLSHAVVSTSASYIGVDLGTVTAFNITVQLLNYFAPTGAFGVSGASSSANVPVGAIGTFRDCKFSGGMGDITGLTTDDIRWAFRDNSPTADTQPDALVSLAGNTTATVTTSGVPIAIAGTWVEQQASHFTTTAAGLLTYIGERPLKVPIDLAVTAHSSSGSNKDIELFIAFNGTPEADSIMEARVSSNSRENITIPWQKTLVTGDTLQAFGANVTDNVGIVYRNAKYRAL